MSIPLSEPNDNDSVIQDMRLAKQQFENFKQNYFNADCRSVDEYRKLDSCEIGKGSFSVVYKAQDTATGEVVALKKFCMQTKDNSINRDFYREINLLKQLKHPNVIQLKDIVVGEKLERVFLVLEFAEDDLGKVMESMKIPFSQDEIKCLMQQLFTGISYLHHNFVVHRDINPCNILLDSSGVLKIADFGSARKCSPAMTPNVGTVCYRAPEILFGFATYTTAIDIWSAGCVFAELLHHTVLFPSKSQMTIISQMIDLLGTPNDEVMPGYSSTAIAQNYNLKHQPYNMIRKKFKAATDNAITFLKFLLSYNPSVRPSAEDCLNFSYFNEEPVACDCLMLKVGIKQKKMKH